jgi:AP-1 complex subunit gamma-1
MSLQLSPPSSPSIPPGGSVSQQLEVANPSNAPLKMRLKISFVADGIPVSDQCDVSNFPVLAAS